jgi:serine/threonine protein kinase
VSASDNAGSESIGHFVVKQPLGQGGMGVVYLAWDPILERDVAVKLMHQALVGDDEYKARFLREARAAGRLTHPNIVAIYEIGEHRDRVYIAMEYVEGSDMKRLIRLHSRIALAYRVQMIADVCRGLHYAHRNGVLHRDVKPSNIRVKVDGTPKLVDFGLARLETHELTPKGTLLGSPTYMAPEQIEEAPADPRSDQYSVGVVLYEFIAGQPPFHSTYIPGLLRKIAEDPPPRLSDVVDDCPEELARIVDRVLSKDPEDRFPDCGALADALMGIDLTIPGVSLEGQIRSALGFESEAAPVPPSAPAPVPASDDATRVPASPDTPPDVTMMAGQTPPSGFFDASILTRSRLFPDERALFKNVEKTLNFYRDSLKEQYQALTRQAMLTYYLWIGCVGLGFLALIAGVVAMLLGYVQEGLITAASSALVFYIQRVFQQREDHYRRLADKKNAHLEYGNQWLLVIQSIEGIQDQDKKVKRQARLVDALTARMSESGPGGDG